MRDPAGGLDFTPTTVVRALRQPIDDHHFLRSALARVWRDDHRLTNYAIEGPGLVVAPRLPFVTMPSEWCDAQLHAAASLTLGLQREAVEAGFDLKDASAWNVIFDGLRPVFCDLLSMVALTTPSWWAAGQFARHFVLPLVLAQRGGLQAHQSFMVWRDGVPPEVAARALGPRRWLTRYWPLMLSASTQASKQAAATQDQPKSLAECQRRRRDLQTGLDWMVAGVSPESSRRSRKDTVWVDYVDRRGHYSEADLQVKRQTVSTWLDATRSTWVLDLGCNSGEFSRMAERGGAQVIAMDQDHDSLQRLFLQCPGSSRIHPVLAVLDDLPAGRGWAGQEFSSLLDRLAGHCDLAMMLALVHHLCIGAAIPLEQVAAFSRRVASHHLIVEWIGSDDPQLRLLCAQRNRRAVDFSIAIQRQAFLDAGWQVAQEVELSGVPRVLALLTRRA